MLKRFKKWFYRGPADLGFRLKRKRGYQSPTLTAGAWCVALAVRHLSMAGRFTGLCCVLLIPYSLVTTSMPIYILASAVGMLFTVDFVVGFLFRPQLTIRRTYPPRVAEGAELSVAYRIVNSQLPGTVLYPFHRG